MCISANKLIFQRVIIYLPLHPESIDIAYQVYSINCMRPTRILSYHNFSKITVSNSVREQSVREEHP